MERRQLSYIVGGNANWRTVWRFLKKLQIELPNDPAIPLLGRHTEESTTERDRCTRVHCSAVYNSQNMKATYVSTAMCPLADECIRKL